MSNLGIDDVGASYGLPADDPLQQRVDRPVAPAIADIRRDLDQLRHTILQARDAAGAVNVQDLKQRIAATGDPTLARELDALLARSARAVRNDSSAGPAVTLEVPRTLTRDGVQAALADLAQARLGIEQADADGDGRITYAEASSNEASRVSQDLGRAATEAFEARMAEWTDRRPALARHVDVEVAHRRNTDVLVRDAVAFHASSAEGTAALNAAYRDLIARGGTLGTDGPGKALWDAEQGALKWLRNLLPFDETRRGHLGDEEIKRLLGTDDLVAFTQETTARLEKALGGPYRSTFLAGSDLPGRRALPDSDSLDPNPSSDGVRGGR